MRNFRSAARKLIGDIKADGKRIAAYGAAAKGTIMLNYLGFNESTLEYVVDKNVHKQGMYMPGVGLRIHDPEHLIDDKPDYLMILPWNFRDEIMRQADRLPRSRRPLHRADPQPGRRLMLDTPTPRTASQSRRPRRRGVIGVPVLRRIGNRKPLSRRVDTGAQLRAARHAGGGAELSAPRSRARVLRRLRLRLQSHLR